MDHDMLHFLSRCIIFSSDHADKSHIRIQDSFCTKNFSLEWAKRLWLVLIFPRPIGHVTFSQLCFHEKGTTITVLRRMFQPVKLNVIYCDCHHVYYVFMWNSI